MQYVMIQGRKGHKRYYKIDEEGRKRLISRIEYEARDKIVEAEKLVRDYLEKYPRVTVGCIALHLRDSGLARNEQDSKDLAGVVIRKLSRNKEVIAENIGISGGQISVIQNTPEQKNRTADIAKIDVRAMGDKKPLSWFRAFWENAKLRVESVVWHCERRFLSDFGFTADDVLRLVFKSRQGDSEPFSFVVDTFCDYDFAPSDAEILKGVVGYLTAHA